MTTGAPLYLVSACNSAEEFVAAFRRYADRSGLFIPIAAPLPQGKKGRIALTLKDGGVMVEGEAEIVQSSPKSPLHGRAGIVVKFTDPDEPSKTVLAELEKARLAMKPSPPSVPPRPADVPAEPRPVPPAVGGRIDAANALAECIVIGDTSALRDADGAGAPPKAGQKFVVPAIPGIGGRPRTPSGAPDTLGRPKTPTGAPDPLGRPKTPTGVPEIKPVDTKATVMGMPALRPPGESGPVPVAASKSDSSPMPAAAPKSDSSPVAASKSGPTPVPVAASSSGATVVGGPPKKDATPEPVAASKSGATVVGGPPKKDPTPVATPKPSPGASGGLSAAAVANVDDSSWTDEDAIPTTTGPTVPPGPTTSPGMAAPAAAPKAESAKTAAPAAEQPKTKSAKLTQLGIPVVKMPAEPGSRPEPPKATTLGMVPLRASSIHQTQPVAVVAPPKDAAVITDKPPRDEEPVPAKKPPLPAPTPTRSKSGTTPPRHPTPATPLPVARVPAKAAPLLDAADEKTDMSEVPVPQTDVGFPNIESEMTERPAPPPEPEARPQRSGGMRASEIMAAVQVDDWTMTPDASAPTVIPSSKPEPEVQEPTPAPKGPPTGNWTISLDPETGWGEPEKLEATTPTPPADKPTKIEKRTPTSAQTPSTGNPVHAVASDKAIEAVQWEDKPTSIGEKIEIDPTLMEPIDPLPSLDDGAGASGGMAGFSPPRGLPAYPPAGSAPNLAAAVSGGMAPLSAASSAELPAPLGPPPAVPSSTGSQPAFGSQDIGYAPTLLPGQMTAPPGGFAYPQAPPQFQGFQSESVAAVPKRSNKRLLVIAASAAAVVIIAIVLAMTMGGKHKKRVAEGKGSAGSAAVVVPPPVVIDAAVAQVQGSDTGSAEGSATQQAVTPPPPPQTCNVEVATTPAGAEVSLEDKTVLGQTPGTFPLPCGAATKLTIKKAKYLTVTRSVTPAPEGTKVAVTLGQGMFTVKVTSSPAGATITVGGKAKGVTPTAVQLPSFTTQTITLSKEGYASDTQKVVIKANGLSHHVTLKKGGKRR